MPAGQGVDVGSIAQTVLDAVVAHFAPSGVALPARQVIAPGAPRQIAWDGEQVIVSMSGIYPGQAQGAAGGLPARTGNPISAGGMRYTVIVVQIVRAVPESDGTDPPDADVLTAAGLALARDAGLLSQCLMELVGQSGALRKAGMAVAGGVEILGPSGYFAAVEGHVEVTAGLLT
ncbi:MAG: hypothetical protein ACRDRO_21600 [Pseudonocardiaceae bacterium]